MKAVRSALPSDLAMDLEASWKLVVSFGHVNPGALWLSKLPGSVVGDPTHRAVTFDGPHNGPLQEHALLHMTMIFTALGESALRLFVASFKERLSPQWLSAFAAQEARVAVRRTQKPTS